MADPDELLLDEDIVARLLKLGFVIVPFADATAFRYLYEESFRVRWDRGEAAELVATVPRNTDRLPYDLVCTGRHLSLGLGDLFPSLSYRIIRELDHQSLDELYAIQEELGKERLGDLETTGMVLRRLFGITPEPARHPAELLAILLKIHHRQQELPGHLVEHLVDALDPHGSFSAWPLCDLLSSRAQFLLFLQERWPLFLDGLAQVAGEAALPQLAVEGPLELPFGHDDVRIYIDTLFGNGHLKPVAHEQRDKLMTSWVRVGLRDELQPDLQQRLAHLAEELACSIPGQEARYGHWSEYSKVWAEMTVLSGGQVLSSIQRQVDSAFGRWAERRFAGLVNLPARTPTMVHHIPRYLARVVERGADTRVALIVIDGLALDQWLIVRDVLKGKRPGLGFREETVFAWIPTTTSVSRQALFAGRTPFFFASSLSTTQREPALWRQFWADQGLSSDDVLYLKGLGDGSLMPVFKALESSSPRVVGLVIDTIDDIMHGIQLGTAGMHNQVRQWAEQPYLDGLLDHLLQHGYRVFLTSDHGNTEAVGCGDPGEGVIAELRGQRVRIYTEVSLRDRFKQKYPCSHEWNCSSLPGNYHPLLAPDRMAFVREGERIVTHGGASLEEVIVPFVEIVRGKER